MIWYILYPFRGTTEPPQLSRDHPIRRAFVRHGTLTARHWLVAILISVAVAVLLCYPVLFLYDSPATGLYNLPHHVWTSASRVEGGIDIPHDVELRQVWVLGSYMKALELSVLKEALDIQVALIGDGFEAHGSHTSRHGNSEVGSRGVYSEGLGDGCGDIPSDLSWSFHSPLMYWNCSLQALEQDADLLGTINSQVQRRSAFNYTLRPSSVFAGKIFSKKQILAADALVITLIDRKGVGKVWEERAKKLARDSSGRWSVYPEDAISRGSQLFEFRVKPMSLHDDVLLATVYLSMAIYVIVSMRKMRAVKSKFGLVVTIFSQIAISVLASFTICGLLRVNLAQVPREMYPFVVIILGLEDMFRLINAVLAHPPQMPPVQRIANALGDVGHLSLAAAAQNLVLLYLLYQFAPPGVAAFCIFTSIALIFEFLFHLIFFIAVLSVDVRRLELQDSLERANSAQANAQSSKLGRQTWGRALLHGKLPFTTRIAGTVVSICFVLTLNWHFFKLDSRQISFSRLFDLAQAAKQNVAKDGPYPGPVNPARTPAAWLKMQDHATARELIDSVKPHAHSAIAKIYDPLTIVIGGSDRNGVPNQSDSVVQALRSIAEEHFFPIALAMVFTIAAVTLLMNYLLWNELPEDSDFEEESDSLLTVRTLRKGHSLDVVRLTTCGKGHLVSISLDRSVCVWLFDARTNLYSSATIKVASMSPQLWPIAASTIDDSGNWLVLCTDGGVIAIWNLSERRFAKFIKIDLNGLSPLYFAFASGAGWEADRPNLIVVTADGRLQDVDIESGQSQTHQVLMGSPLLAATGLCYPRGIRNIVTAARNGALYASSCDFGQWSTRSLDDFGPRLLPDGKLSKVRSVLASPALNMVVAIRLCEVDLIDFAGGTVIHTFQTSQVKGSSLRVLHSPKRTCPQCGSTGVHSLSLAYTEVDTNNFIMQTYTIPSSPSGLICLRSPLETTNGTPSCLGPDNATQSLNCLEQGGAWEGTTMQAVIGIRKRPSPLTPDPSSPGSTGADISYFNNFPNHPVSVLKHRIRESKLNQFPTAARMPSSSPDPDDWEVWTMNTVGELHVKPLEQSHSYPHDGEQLFVASPGPISRLGKRAVAVGFGNTVKMIFLGSGRFEEDECESRDQVRAGSVSRRRRVAGRKAI